MTVKELIVVLSKYDGDLEVVSAVDSYDYPEDIEVSSIKERDFEIDVHHRALVFKATGYMPDTRDWNSSYPHGIPWKESKDSEP